jgi:hypothetical protein
MVLFGVCDVEVERDIELQGSIRNGFMPHIMGHKLSHFYAREVR